MARGYPNGVFDAVRNNISDWMWRWAESSSIWKVDEANGGCKTKQVLDASTVLQTTRIVMEAYQGVNH